MVIGFAGVFTEEKGDEVAPGPFHLVAGVESRDLPKPVRQSTNSNDPRLDGSGRDQ